VVERKKTKGKRDRVRLVGGRKRGEEREFGPGGKELGCSFGPVVSQLAFFLFALFFVFSSSL